MRTRLAIAVLVLGTTGCAKHTIQQVSPHGRELYITTIKERDFIWTWTSEQQLHRCVSHDPFAVPGGTVTATPTFAGLRCQMVLVKWGADFVDVAADAASGAVLGK